jgi:hypothetical protein
LLPARQWAHSTLTLGNHQTPSAGEPLGSIWLRCGKDWLYTYQTGTSLKLMYQALPKVEETRSPLGMSPSAIPSGKQFTKIFLPHSATLGLRNLCPGPQQDI